MPYEKMYRENYGIVYGYIYSLCKNENLTEELTAQTFLKAIEHFSSYNGTGKLSSWLCAIAKNEYLHYLRHNKRRIDNEDIEAAADNTRLETQLEDKEAAMRLHQLIHNLEEPYHEVFVLRVFAELSFREIGTVMGWSESRARVTYHRAKIMLKKQMEGYL